ncbi:MAG: nitrite reductase (cytochrome c-552), partial [Mariniblastus sp.]
FPQPPEGGFGKAEVPTNHIGVGEAHPVSCVDCHDPKSMAIRVTRPGFVNGIAALAESEPPTRVFPRRRIRVNMPAA